MTDGSKIQEFPDIKDKLAAPTKKSLFERQKADAAAKRRREEAETAAALKDFVQSFDDDDPPASSASRFGERTGPSRGGDLGPGGPRRQFAGPPPLGPSGRGGTQGSRGGSLPSKGIGSLGPPPSTLSRKRTLDGDYPPPRDNREGLFAFDDSPPRQVVPRAAFHTSDDENDGDEDDNKAERAAPKPTLHLSSLPPGTSPAVIKSLLLPPLSVEAVRILPPHGPSSTDRKSVSAIVTLAKDTPASDIDNAVNSLSNRYLGWGYHLSLSRHLSSAALQAGAPVQANTLSTLSSLPFGAKALQPIPGGGGGAGSMNRAPPPSSIHRGGFAPPSSYGINDQYSGRGASPVVHVSVQPPSDLKQLKLIHKTVESLVRHGPEFEALLMSRPEVQRNEKWAWIWDPRSKGGVWYRWRLWQVLSGSRGANARLGKGATKGRSEFVFDGGAAWTAPTQGLAYEYITKMEEFVSDSEYHSSDEDESGDEEMPHRRHHHQHGGPPPSMEASSGAAGDGEETAYLNPLKKAKLTHLLARLPASNAKLRKGDVARVTAFAIEHAGEGADEVVDLIVSNVESPFAFTAANLDRARVADDDVIDEGDEPSKDKEKEKEKEDTTPAILVGLYLISDILSSSSTSGVRHAWRYRQLFETALQKRQVFEYLGRLERTHQWGRLRAEKWKRSVGGILTQWEGWCVFPQAAQEHFVEAFRDPPPTASELEEERRAEEKAAEIGGAGAAKSKWRTVDANTTATDDSLVDGPSSVGPNADVDMDEGEDGEDVDGEPMESDEDFDIDGVPMDDVDGEPMDTEPSGVMGGSESRHDHQHEDLPVQQKGGAAPAAPLELDPTVAGSSDPGEADTAASSAVRRRPPRPKAEDMFADSDED